MTDQKADPDAEASSESSREPAPSGAQIQNMEQNALQQRGVGCGHACEGAARCPCQRYENGELALVVMNRNRNPANQYRDDSYQNVGRAQQQPRGLLQNRGNNVAPAINQNFLNPQYQNPVDLLGNYNRNGRINEPEENIYERLDDYEDDDDDPRAEGARNENSGNAEVAVDPNIADNHTYERIDNRPWYRGPSANNNRATNNYQAVNHLPPANFWNFMEPSNSSNHYDNPRYAAHPKARALDSRDCLNRLGRLGRNCFSSENIASAANPRRYVYQLGHNRIMCQSCSRIPFMYRDGRYACQHCNDFHERMRYYNSGNPTGPLGNSRHYIYQISRNCRCAYCRGDYQYARSSINTNRMMTDLFRRNCQCRNPGNSCCRGRIMSSSNSAIYIGRIDHRAGLAQSVNNPLYSSPTIYIGRIDRSCASGLSANAPASGGGNSSLASNTESIGAAVSSTSNASSSSTLQSEPSTSSNQRGPPVNAPGPSGSGTGGSSVCPISQSMERRHICDDSCIRSHPGNVTGVCQFLGRSERPPDCHNGRVSFHWWFVNRWLPPWGSQNQSTERNAPPAATATAAGTAEQPPAAPKAEEPRESQESDTEEFRD